MNNTVWNLIKTEVLKTQGNDYVLNRFEYIPGKRLLVEHVHNPELAAKWRKDHSIQVSSILTSENPEKKLKQTLSLFKTKLNLPQEI